MKLLLAATILLTGCVSMYMDEYLKPYVGQDIHAAVAKLGYPDSQRVILGDTVYAWSHEHRGVLILPTATTTTGRVGDVGVNVSSYGSEAMPTHSACQIQMAVDSAGIVKNYQWIGSDSGCSPYLRALIKH